MAVVQAWLQVAIDPVFSEDQNLKHRRALTDPASVSSSMKWGEERTRGPRQYAVCFLSAQWDILLVRLSLAAKLLSTSVIFSYL